MGASGSTRRLSIGNEEAHVIKVSDSVVRRIRSELSTAAPRDEAPAASKSEQQQSSAAPSEMDAPQRQSPSSSESEDGVFSHNAVLTVMRLREEKEAAVRRLEQEWRDRLRLVEAERARLPEVSQQAFEQSAAQTRRMFTPAVLQPVCTECQDRVVSCYSEHQKKPLLCSREVQQFSECVSLARLSKMAPR